MKNKSEYLKDIDILHDALSKVNPKEVTTDALPEELIAKALIANKGLVTYAANALGVSNSAISQRVTASPFLQEVKRQCIERRLDIAEKNLTELTEEKDLGALCFTLKTIGKHRGYTEHVANDQTSEETNSKLDKLFDQMDKMQEKK
jgi:predicted transcriptional regulator